MIQAPMNGSLKCHFIKGFASLAFILFPGVAFESPVIIWKRFEMRFPFFESLVVNQSQMVNKYKSSANLNS
jgi:hypothetical protein